MGLAKRASADAELKHQTAHRFLPIQACIPAFVYSDPQTDVDRSLAIPVLIKICYSGETSALAYRVFCLFLNNPFALPVKCSPVSVASLPKERRISSKKESDTKLDFPFLYPHTLNSSSTLAPCGSNGVENSKSMGMRRYLGGQD